jgi:hypothetical protein
MIRLNTGNKKLLKKFNNLIIILSKEGKNIIIAKKSRYNIFF